MAKKLRGVLGMGGVLFMAGSLFAAPGKVGQDAQRVSAAVMPMSDEEFMQGVHKLGEAGLVAPVAIKQNEPRYTADAMREKLQGDVRVEAVVDVDGTVLRARVAKSLDKVYGLDAEALAAVKRDLFRPGTLNGQPVQVLATVELTFRLH